MKKRRLSLLLAALLLLFAAPVLAQDGADGLLTGTIINGPVAVFNGTDAAAGVIGQLQTGSAVIITGEYDGWIQVFSPAERIVGWVDGGFVRADAKAQTVYPGIVISQSVSLREAPSTGARRIASIPNGSVLDLLDEQNGWYYVRCWDSKTQTEMEGYVVVDYVVRDPLFVTTTKSTYVYSTPDRGSKKVGQLVSGTQLVVIGEWGDFWVVNLRSASGFLYKRDIEIVWVDESNG